MDEQQDSGAVRLSADAQMRWAVIGLTLPALMYLVTYSVLAGEAEHFGVPLGLISVSLSDVLKIGLTSGTVTLVVTLAVRGLLPARIRGRLHVGLEVFVWPLLLLFAYSALMWWAYGDGPQARIWFLAAVGLTILSAIALFISARRAGSIVGALEEAGQGQGIRWWSSEFWSSAMDGAMRLRLTDALILIVAALYLLSAARLLGRGYARNAMDFMVCSSSDKAVVVLVNDGMAVVGHLEDDDPHLLGSQFETIELSSLGEVQEKSIGPLRGQGLRHPSK